MEGALLCRGTGGGGWVWGVFVVSGRPPFRGAGKSKVLIFTGFGGCDLRAGRDLGLSSEGCGGREDTGVINVDDLGRPTARPDEVVDSETEMGDRDGEAL